MPSEFDRIAAIKRRLTCAADGVMLGIGDDAAVLAPSERPQVYSVDTQVEGVHFRRDWLAPPGITLRAIAAALSDLAAMGATPRGALLAWVLPRGLSEEAFDGLVEGAAEAQRRFACPILGGNLARGAELSLTTTVIGELEGPALTRAGAQPGDIVYVTGPLGAAAFGLALLECGQPELGPQCVERFLRPTPRLAEGRALSSFAHAAIDISDGLLQDLHHVARQSGVQIEIDSTLIPLPDELRTHGPQLGKVPLQLALTGGEDYELAFCAPAGRKLSCGIAIGRVDQGNGVHVLDEHHQKLSIRIAGFDHFE